MNRSTNSTWLKHAYIRCTSTYLGDTKQTVNTKQDLLRTLSHVAELEFGLTLCGKFLDILLVCDRPKLSHWTPAENPFDTYGAVHQNTSTIKTVPSQGTSNVGKPNCARRYMMSNTAKIQKKMNPSHTHVICFTKENWRKVWSTLVEGKGLKYKYAWYTIRFALHASYIWYPCSSRENTYRSTESWAVHETVRAPNHSHEFLIKHMPRHSYLMHVNGNGKYDNLNLHRYSRQVTGWYHNL